VEIRIYDVGGRQIRLLRPAEIHDPGKYKITWDARDDRGRDLAAGVYFYRVRTPARSAMGRLVLVR
jgi:hypothetical protein